MQTQHICLIGHGAWGQAIAKHITTKTQLSILNKEEKIETINHNQADNTWEKIAPTITGIIICTPSQAVGDVLKSLKKKQINIPILCASKGLYFSDKAYLFHELYQKLFPKQRQFCYLSGPNFANEVLTNIPTAAIVAGDKADFWQPILHHAPLHISLHQDLIGTALCGIYKNIAALIAGFCEHPSLGENTRAALLTKAIEALRKTITHCQGDEQTALNIAGIGDIILSGTSTQSRNYTYGKQLALGLALKKEHTTESIINVEKIQIYLQQQNRICPLIETAIQCLKHPQNAHHILVAWLDQQT